MHSVGLYVVCALPLVLAERLASRSREGLLSLSLSVLVSESLLLELDDPLLEELFSLRLRRLTVLPFDRVGEGVRFLPFSEDVFFTSSWECGHSGDWSTFSMGCSSASAISKIGMGSFDRIFVQIKFLKKIHE